MPTTYAAVIRLIAVAVFLNVSTICFSQVLPVTVSKVEPPSWRATPSSSDIVLHLSGDGLDGVVAVKTKHKGVRVLRTEAPDGNHLLIYLQVSRDAAPGTMMLQISSRFTTTFTAVPMFGDNAPVTLTAGK